MPMDMMRYPANWKTISLRIREREGWRCKWCGAENGKPHPITGSKVVLTVAHINHDTTDNSEENLAALCQRDHLRHDAKYHAINAAETRRRRKIEAGQQELGL
jgi:hypothetical protein